MRELITIRSGELVLRELAEEDSTKIALHGADESAAADMIQRIAENHRRNSPGNLFHLCLGIFMKGTGDFAGWCGLDNTGEGRPNPVLFYVVEEAYRGRGFATEAAEAMLHHGFTTLDLPVIDAGVAVDNGASIRILEKTGMHRIESSEDGYLQFTITREEFLKTP
ncbi:MAG TPA: GNAT family N-acetyltransferase [Candidatus Sabulitectum sp.]|nr:GNAT family N-acetyltransferase [Candidatus Sabulitectum sp.]HPJ28802.1 GNAT family N-acetyltransferase [Candidatus Sabulitectum sp.]HRW78300.1 GNAT family N-acetyltransferase [Candidatus Sabulitectum sp.]